MTCRTCHRKPAEDGAGECFNCRVRSVGFAYRGAGYTRAAFHDTTIAEKRREILGDRVLGVDVEPASNYGW